MPVWQPASVVVAAAFLIGCGSPKPDGTAVGTDGASAADDLTRSGNTVTFVATDDAGPWATITLTRGRDVDHYPGHLPTIPGTYAEVQVRYEITANRPQRPFGSLDWYVRYGDVPQAFPADLGPIATAPQPHLSVRLNPRAGEVVEGWLYVPIAAEFGDVPVWLLFEPARPGAMQVEDPDLADVDFQVLLRP